MEPAWSWSVPGNESVPDVEAFKAAAVIGRYGYDQATIDRIATLTSLKQSDYLGSSQFSAQREQWAAQCDRSADNKEVYKVTVEGEPWFIGFYDGIVSVGRKVHSHAGMKLAADVAARAASARVALGGAFGWVRWVGKG